MNLAALAEQAVLLKETVTVICWDRKNIYNILLSDSRWRFQYTPYITF